MQTMLYNTTEYLTTADNALIRAERCNSIDSSNQMIQNANIKNEIII